MSNYGTLVRILDQIRKEAPAEYKSYYPLETDIEKINQARAKALIHLYLKVKFGLLDFGQREQYVTDGIDDGGIDAYYIDAEAKKIYLMQSKFRANAPNFQSKEIELQDILKMDVDRILKGETCYESGQIYNGKVQSLIKNLQAISNIALYNYQIVILANLTNVSPSELKKLVGSYEANIINYARCYRELVFPVVSGTYFSAKDVFVSLDLTGKSAGSRVRYEVETEFAECEITVVFVPTIEIAKILHKYKNSVLKYNPRSYLDLSSNPVNSEIAKTITRKTTNEFALFNNGITMLSDETLMTEQTGQKNRAQLKVTNPQILNGGQTAYTLSKVYSEQLKSGNPELCFKDKEVLVKVITFTQKAENAEEQAKKLQLIEAISKATNQQTAVTEADRRSNDKVQIEIQERIFNEFGLFYERKRGEFWNGRQEGYVDANKIIDRELFLRICLACNGFASQARRNSEEVIFGRADLYGTLNKPDKTRQYYFGFLCHRVMNEIEKKFDAVPNNKYGVLNYGNAIRYGKMAVVYVACRKCSDGTTKDGLEQTAEKVVNEYIEKWPEFESSVSKLAHNSDYFTPYVDAGSNTVRYEMNWANYYKGRNLNEDLRGHFKN